MFVLRPSLAWALAWALAQPVDATAEAPETPAQRAQRHFEAEQWDEAIEALIEAYAADPDPAYLYARAQAERMRGDCKMANALYRRFLESDPTPKQRADTERHIRLCEEVLFEQTVEAQPAEPEPQPQPEPEPKPDRPRRDPVGPALLGTGLVAAATGMTVTILGSNMRGGAPEAATEQEYEDDGRRGAILLGTGLAVAGIGVALIAGGIARFAVMSKRRRMESTTASRRLDVRFDGAVVRGRF